MHMSSDELSRMTIRRWSKERERFGAAYLAHLRNLALTNGIRLK